MSATEPDRRGRFLVALTIGLAAAWLARNMAQRGNLTTDFEFLWRGARLWAEGRDPYAMRPATEHWPLADRL